VNQLLRPLHPHLRASTLTDPILYHNLRLFLNPKDLWIARCLLFEDVMLARRIVRVNLGLIFPGVAPPFYRRVFHTSGFEKSLSCFVRDSLRRRILFSEVKSDFSQEARPSCGHAGRFSSKDNDSPNSRKQVLRDGVVFWASQRLY